jgi:hypothetical protein
MERNNNRDEIVEEVRAARQAYAARFGFDIRRIVDDLKAKESKHPERRADLRPSAVRHCWKTFTSLPTVINRPSSRYLPLKE